jgi:Cd2+/Zn2+-exporting ATPase
MSEDTVTIENTENHTHHNHNHSPGITCPVCGHQNLTEGTGHGRTIGRLSMALIGGYFIFNSYLLEWQFPGQAFSASLSALIGAVILAIPIVFAAVKDLYQGKIYMNELVALAILAALAGGNFKTAGMIAFFLLITIIIESRTASGAQRSIEELIKLTPNRARKILEDGSEEEMDVSGLNIGDIIAMRPGENFPIDGDIVSGESIVNQASITGESLPVDKGPGDEVYAGTQNLTGGLKIKVTKLGENTTLGKVKEMILAAEGSKTPIVRIIDRYAGYYTPTILMIAGITWWINGDMNRVITLMVIACPCAIVLATPTAVVAAVAAAARLGIYIKNVGHLELAAKIRTFVFDKTGTLTDGELSVVKLSPAEGTEPAELLQLAATVEKQSNHPTAKALQILAEEAELELDSVDNFSEIHGKGVKADLNGEACYVGRAAWLETLGFDLSDLDSHEKENQESGMSMVFAARGKKILGWIGLRDKVRNEASRAINDLKSLGVKKCAMVTGDRQAVAELVANKLDIEDFQGECLPENKVEYVTKVKESSMVAFVGDGVNDAPALAAGDLGIAMGAIGSDIAVSSASVALMTNDLRRIPMLVSLSKKSRIIINQNLFIGMVFVLGGIILSVFGYLSPVTAAVLHTFSTILILFNSARLIRTGEEITLSEKA